MSTTVNFVINTTDTGTEITEPTRDESDFYCTTEVFPGLDACPFPQQPLQTHLPQPGERLMLIRSTNGAFFDESGDCFTGPLAPIGGEDFPSGFWAGWYFLAFPPTGGRPKRGHLNDPQNAAVPPTPLVRGDKIVVTGIFPGDGGDTCTTEIGAGSITRHFIRLVGEKQ